MWGAVVARFLHRLSVPALRLWVHLNSLGERLVARELWWMLCPDCKQDLSSPYWLVLGTDSSSCLFMLEEME